MFSEQLSLPSVSALHLQYAIETTVLKYLQGDRHLPVSMIMEYLGARRDAAFADDPKAFRPVRTNIKEAEATSLLHSKCSTWRIPEVNPSISQTGDAERIKAGF